MMSLIRSTKRLFLPLVLMYFDSSKPIKESGDASSQGIGFVLTRDDHPVTYMYASRALTKAEQRYSQIEKKLLAQACGLEHNHQHVYARQKSHPLHRSQALDFYLEKTTSICTKTTSATSPPPKPPKAI